MLPLSRQNVKSLYDTAVARIKAGQLEQAARDLQTILTVLPNSPEAHYQLSQIAHKLGQHAAWANHLARAVALKPKDPALNEAAVEAFNAIGDFDAALAAHDQLIAAAPNDLKRKVDKALTLQYAGQFEAAETLLHSLIVKNPKVGALYRIYMMTARIPADDPLMDRMRKLIANPKLPDLDKMHICFATAKALEVQGRFDQVFAALDRANGLQRKLYPLDHARNDLQNAALRQFQHGADLTPAGPDIAIRSVFVTGMPRSGTTLVEQILASHSQVTAGGELPFASRLTVNLFGDKDAFLPLGIAPQPLINDFARGYVQAVRQSTGISSGVVTDKAIQAHRIYGLLHRALKGVRFVVVHRDPRDIALSIYKNHFRTGTHRYANDFADIAQEIKAFRANVAYWKTRLPDAITEIRYEDLVSDSEPQIRALIAAAGLAWEDACLDFHASKGAVKTLSLQQVRQPIYKGSAQAWRKYETELAPFIAAWGDDPWD